ncbi:MAG UNVERIFIED_CONTAM: hypothetical protein LVR18_34295 [Planctomycetaceae bacterium]|jgi:hypothetical protein
MNELEQLWRERIDWVQASGLTIAAASAEQRSAIQFGEAVRCNRVQPQRLTDCSAKRRRDPAKAPQKSDDPNDRL